MPTVPQDPRTANCGWSFHHNLLVGELYHVVWLTEAVEGRLEPGNPGDLRTELDVWSVSPHLYTLTLPRSRGLAGRSVCGSLRHLEDNLYQRLELLLADREMSFEEFLVEGLRRERLRRDEEQYP